jgi:DNA-binding beta-propeller fold protein YncE
MKRMVLLALLVLASPASARQTGGTFVALVTAERQNQLIAVELSTGKTLRRVTVPADPQNVAALAGRSHTVVVVSTRAGAVTLLAWKTLKTVKVFHGLASPHLAAISPSGKWAYVTDDGRGELDVIALGPRRMVDRVFVGAGAHHLTISPGGRRAWVALGEHASEIAIVDISRPARPRLLRRFSPGFVVHDLTFSPDGRRVWVTSGVGDSVHVLSARSGKQVFAVRVGAAPQHVAFSEPIRGFAYAYATSGYSSRIVKIDPQTGRIVARARTPYGSFNLATLGEGVVTTSLINGRLTDFDQRLRVLRTTRPAPAARGVALDVWP